MAEPQDGCVTPSKGPIMPEAEQSSASPASPPKEAPKVLAKVGKPAPDFEAAAYLDGGFKNIRLSDYQGQWVVICFYPGDFTFV